MPSKRNLRLASNSGRPIKVLGSVCGDYNSPAPPTFQRTDYWEQASLQDDIDLGLNREVPVFERTHNRETDLKNMLARYQAEVGVK